MFLRRSIRRYTPLALSDCICVVNFGCGSPHLNALLPRSEKNLNRIYASLYDDKVVLWRRKNQLTISVATGVLKKHTQEETCLALRPHGKSFFILEL
jgi:hypothetical protein